MKILFLLLASSLCVSATAAVVSGSVVFDGLPLPGAVVQFHAEELHATAVSREDGRYELALPVGRCRARVDMDGFESRTVDVCIETEGTQLDFDVTLGDFPYCGTIPSGPGRPILSTAGRIVDERSRSLPGAVVQLVAKQDLITAEGSLTRETRLSSATVGDSGEFVLALPQQAREGYLVLVVEADGYAPITVPFAWLVRKKVSTIRLYPLCN